jgi:thioredoxin 1
MIEPKTKAELEKVLAENPVVIIDWSLTFCPPCKTMAPRFKKMEGIFQDVAAFVKVTLDDEETEVNIDYLKEVSAAPTFYGVVNGKIVMEEEGSMTEKELRKFIEDTIAQKPIPVGDAGTATVVSPEEKV